MKKLSIHPFGLSFSVTVRATTDLLILLRNSMHFKWDLK